MTPDWSTLQTELARWRDAGLTLPVWWRDDDAIAPTPELERLTALSAGLGLPVHLAVIPEPAQPPLCSYMNGHSNLIPLVHGWAHTNHEPPEVKTAEFGAARGVQTALDDIARGHARLHEMFGHDLRPMFVPPWNRIAPGVVAGLSGQGFSMLSTSGPRKARFAAPGVTQINIHLDLIDWRGTRSAVDMHVLIGTLCTHLADRRTGRADNSEPYGILTHHLVHDEAIWQVTTQVLTHLLNGPAVPWIAPKTDMEPG